VEIGRVEKLIGNDMGKVLSYDIKEVGVIKFVWKLSGSIYIL
jgi:hypothetical protein